MTLTCCCTEAGGELTMQDPQPPLFSILDRSLIVFPATMNTPVARKASLRRQATSFTSRISVLALFLRGAKIKPGAGTGFRSPTT
jgi:hypothetical protein